MSAPLRATNEDIIAAYKQTGSVWAAAKLLGIGGQSVHERLRALNYPLASQVWTLEEIAELRSLLGHMTLGQIGQRLGRPYSGVAAMVSKLGLAGSGKSRRVVRVPRGAGYDKASVSRYVKQLTASGDRVGTFARRNGLGLEALCNAIERHFPDWWQEYRRNHSDLAERECIYCQAAFIPSTTKQTFCSRQCGSTRRADESYFGGKRRQTIGLKEKRCQLCAREVVKGLSSHHVLGKENDPDNTFLIALCPGCHKAVTLLASRTFVDEPEAWQSLISLVWLRKHGADDNNLGVYTYVEIEPLDEEDVSDEAS